MPSEGRGRRTWWWLSAVVFPILLGVAAALLVWFLRGQGLGRSDQWSSVLQLFLTIMAVAVPGWAWMRRRARLDDVPDAAVLGGLRQAVHVAWSQEVASRGLHAPLQLRWRPTSRPGVQSGASGLEQARRRGGALLGRGDRPAAAALAEALSDPGVRQLVVLGEPGAGKTTLAVLYVVAATGAGGPEDPVPVLLPVAGWDPAAPSGLQEWIVQRISQDYPQATVAAVRRLVRQRRVIPVLDGLDEMPTMLRRGALDRLEEAAGAGLRMVLTCRGEEFAQAIAEAGALPQAVVVEVEPVGAGDAVEYLKQREALGSGRWDPVAAAMTTDPDGPLASALSTPLMISLARQVFRRPASDPGELAHAGTAQAVQGRLLHDFLPSAFGSSQAGEKAGRWLAFLVTHLPAHPGDPNLQWWRLARAVPRLVIIVMITVVMAVLGVLVGVVVAATTDVSGSISRGIGFGALLGIVFGLVAGRQAARTTRDFDRRPGWLSLIANGIGDLLAAAATVSALATLTLLAGWALAAPTAVSMSAGVANVVTGLAGGDDLAEATLFAFLGIILVVLTYGLGSGRGGLPRRSRPLARRFPRYLLGGLGIGLLVGLPWTVLGLFQVAGLSLFMGLVLTLFTAGFIGVTWGLGRWLSSPVTRPQEGRSPGSVLRSDRRALLATGFGVFVAYGIVSLVPWATGTPFTDAAPPWLALGAAAGALVVFGSGPAWVSYTAARVWLALRGKLPWRLFEFLRDAYRRGVLRQAGAAYQIRHDLIREYVVERWAPSSGGGRTASTVRKFTSRFRWRLITVPAGVVAVGLLPVVALVIDPRPLPLASIHGIGTVLSSDGSRIAIIMDDDKVRVSDARTGRTIATLGDAPFLSHIKLSPDGRMLAVVGGHDHKVRLWDTSTGRMNATVGSSWPDDPLFSPDGQILATVGADQRVRLWDTVTGRAIATLGRVPVLSGRLVMTFSPDGRNLATVNAVDPGAAPSPAIQLWDTSTGRAISTFGSVSASISAAISPDGTVAAVETVDDQVQLWDTFAGRMTAAIAPARFTIGGPQFSPDGRILATLGDNRIELWDTTTGRRTASLDPSLSHSELRLSPDGRTLAAIPLFARDGGDGAVRLWDTSTDSAIATLDEVDGSFAEFSPDGRTLATVDAKDFRVRLWRASTGRQTATLDPVALDTDMGFSRDSRTIFTDSIHDSTVRLWNVPG